MGFPIFLIGHERSGTTLVQRILNTVEGVAILGEHGGFLTPLADAYHAAMDSSVSRRAASRDLASIRQRLRQPEVWPAWINALDVVSIRSSFASLLQSIFRPWDDGAVEHWGFKEIRYGSEDCVLDMLIDVFPDARFVFIARHPVNALASTKVFRSPPLPELIEKWDARYRHYHAFSSRHPEHCVFVRYEDVTEGHGVESLLSSLSLPCAETQLAVLDEEGGRYASPMREKGMDPVERFDVTKVRSIYAGTVESRGLLGYRFTGNPRRFPDVTVQKRDGEDGYEVVRDGAARLSIDAIGAAILSLCDGSSRPEQIAGQLREAFDNAPDDIEDDVRAALETLLQHKVIESVTVATDEG